MKWITKGTWYYELQIFMLVVMWCHNNDFYNDYLKKRTDHFRIGRLVIWKDSLWLKRPKYKELSLKIKILYLRLSMIKLKLFGVFTDIKISITKVKLYFLKKQLVVLEFFDSLKVYLELNKAGLRIGKWTDDTLPGDYVRYRFFWKDDLIRDIPDIVRVRDAWKTVNNGHIGSLTKPNSFFNKEYRQLMTKQKEDDLFDDGTYPYIHKEQFIRNRVGPVYHSQEWYNNLMKEMSKIKLEKPKKE